MGRQARTASKVAARTRGRAGGQAFDRGFYMEGACDVFALALASLTGLPLGALTDENGFIFHVVVVVDDKHYADARGITTGEVDELLSVEQVRGLFSTCNMSRAQMDRYVATARRHIRSDPALSELVSGE